MSNDQEIKNYKKDLGEHKSNICPICKESRKQTGGRLIDGEMHGGEIFGTSVFYYDCEKCNVSWWYSTENNWNDYKIQAGH